MIYIIKLKGEKKMKEENRINTTPKKYEGVNVKFGVNDAGEAVAIKLDRTTRPNIRIHGGSGSGKTVLLKTIIGNLNAEYGNSDIDIFMIDASIGGGYRDYVAPKGGQWKIRFYNYANPMVASCMDVFDYLTAMAEYRVKSLSLYGVDDIESWNNTFPEQFRSVVIIIDEYQRFFGTSSEKSFCNMVNTIASVGYDVDMHIIMASQSDKGTKIGLNETARDSFELNICLKCYDELTSTNTVGIPDAMNLKIGEGFFVQRDSREPVHFKVNAEYEVKNTVVINNMAIVMSDEERAAMQEMMKEMVKHAEYVGAEIG